LVISTPGPRNRLRYAVTDLGAHLLRESLRPDEPNCWKAGKADIFESLPRGIILAWLHSGVDEARRGVARAAETLLVVTRRRQREAEELRGYMLHLQAGIAKADPSADQGELVATAYKWIKAESDATLFRLQAESLERINQLLADLPPAPQLR
jgi:hypothetical protein